MENLLGNNVCLLQYGIYCKVCKMLKEIVLFDNPSLLVSRTFLLLTVRKRSERRRKSSERPPPLL